MIFSENRYPLFRIILKRRTLVRLFFLREMKGIQNTRCCLPERIARRAESVSVTYCFIYVFARPSDITSLIIGILYSRLASINEPKEVAMQVGDILRKKTARVATVRMNETVAIAAQLMRSSNISALVVKDVVHTEGNTAAGMFTERDVVRAIAEHGAAGANMRVSHFISVQQLVSCTSRDSLEHVRHLMNRHHIRHLPVIDNYSLIGVISIRDIAAAFDEQAMATREAVPA
jgi:CBS domain-containing protein